MIEDRERKRGTVRIAYGPHRAALARTGGRRLRQQPPELVNEFEEDDPLDGIPPLSAIMNEIENELRDIKPMLGELEGRERGEPTPAARAIYEQIKVECAHYDLRRIRMARKRLDDAQRPAPAAQSEEIRTLIEVLRLQNERLEMILPLIALG
ncbi:MAG: hypothetical protein ACYDCF_05105 [Burkholderiales bacterium]